jgi:hypothetical protein
MPGHGWIAIVELVESDGSSPPSYTTWQYQDYPVDSSGNWGGTFDLGVHVQPGPAYLVATCYYSLGPDPSVDEVHYQPIAFTVQPASPRVSAKTVAFGPARIGTTTPARTVTVTNVGGAPLSITSTTITGTNARDFVIVQDGCSGVAVLSGTSCSTRVAFRPSAHGNRTATLRYGFYPATSSVAVALTGRGCLALLGSLCI